MGKGCGSPVVSWLSPVGNPDFAIPRLYDCPQPLHVRIKLKTKGRKPWKLALCLDHAEEVMDEMLKPGFGIKLVQLEEL